MSAPKQRPVLDYDQINIIYELLLGSKEKSKIVADLTLKFGLLKAKLEHTLATPSTLAPTLASTVPPLGGGGGSKAVNKLEMWEQAYIKSLDPLLAPTLTLAEKESVKQHKYLNSLMSESELKEFESDLGLML